MVRGCREWRLILRAKENDEAHRHGNEIEDEQNPIEQNREVFDRRRRLIERVQWLVATSPSAAQQLPKVSNIVEHFSCQLVTVVSGRLRSAAPVSLRVGQHQRTMNGRQARSFRRRLIGRLLFAIVDEHRPYVEHAREKDEGEDDVSVACENAEATFGLRHVVGDDLQVDGEREKNADSQGDLLAAVRRQTEGEQRQRGDDEERHDDLEHVEARETNENEIDLDRAEVARVMRIEQVELVNRCMTNLPFGVDEVVQAHHLVETAQCQLTGIVDARLKKNRARLPIERETAHVDLAEGDQLRLVGPSDAACADRQHGILQLEVNAGLAWTVECNDVRRPDFVGGEEQLGPVASIDAQLFAGVPSKEVVAPDQFEVDIERDDL